MLYTLVIITALATGSVQREAKFDFPSLDSCMLAQAEALTQKRDFELKGEILVSAKCVRQGADPKQSWDQENLKRNDRGCPTAIFTAPGGELRQCVEPATKVASTPMHTLKYFKSADEAAIYAVAKVYAFSHYYEFGGVIVKTENGYAYSVPHTSHHGMDVQIDEDPEDYGFPIAATYHVHPCLRNVFPSVFSPQDLAGARSTGHPGYVLDECTGAVHYWAPGDGYLDADALLKLGVTPRALEHGIQLSPGKIVGQIKVDGIVLN